MQISAFFAVLGWVLSAAALPASPTVEAALPTSTANVAGLHALAKAAGKLYFGTATDNPELTDQPYVAILNDAQMFGQITAANSMKWDATEPEQGVFTFTQGDQIAALATNEGRLLRGGLRCGCGARRCVTERVDIPRAQLRMASAATELGHVGNIHR